MIRARRIRTAFAGASLILVGAMSGVSAEDCTLTLPGNPNNRLRMCSPEAGEIDVEIRRDQVRLTWNAPARDQSVFRSDVVARDWIGVAPGAIVPGIQVTGIHQAVRDRRIALGIIQVGGETVVDGVPATGVVGTDLVFVSWSSSFESSTSGPLGGVLVVSAALADQPLQFQLNTTPPDTTLVGGLRVTFASGMDVRFGDFAFFDIEDFEGFHVWRWGADPTRTNFKAHGAYSKLDNIQRPMGAWEQASPRSTRFTFVDRDVFDGFVYHYAITTYDQGFDLFSGASLGVKFNSPVEPATRNPDGSFELHGTQKRVAFNKPPPPRFRPIAAVPNPFRDSEIDPSTPETSEVRFINSPPVGTLLIYTMAGDLVHEIVHEDPNVGTLKWDTRNSRGESVTSGVYLYKIVDLSTGRQSFGRLAIIR